MKVRITKRCIVKGQFVEGKGVRSLGDGSFELSEGTIISVSSGETFRTLVKAQAAVPAGPLYGGNIQQRFKRR
jgi:hypothetical protein